MARQKNITARSLLEDQRGSAAQLLTDSGLDSWTRQKYDLQQSQQDFSNYLSSGAYSVDNNQKYRDMATQAVADLDAEMKRYGTNSNEYKTLKGYKTYYQNALPTFDRLDVGANVQDYLSYDQDKGFTNWHSQDDYNTQKSYLDQQRQAVQAELDAIEDQTSVDYQNLKSWQEQLDMYDNALEERNTWDRQFTDINDYTAYERAGDYKNSIQAKQTLKEAQDQLKETEAQLKAMQMKFGIVTDLSTLDGEDALEYQDFINLQQDYKQLQENVTNAAAEVAGLEKWQKNTATYNLLSQYGEDADYEQVLNDLRAAREKAQEGTEDWAKIDLQIRAIAGENEDGLNENGQYDDSTLLGRSIMRDFDVDAAQKRLNEIDQELKDLGVSTSRFWGGVLDADKSFGVDAAGMVYDTNDSVGESDPRVMALRQEKTELTRKLNSAEKFQEKDAAETAFKNLSDEDHAALQEEGLKHISQKGNNFYRDGGYDPTQSSGMLENFQYLDDELGGDIRDMLIEAIGAEALGRDIGYTADDIMRLYQGDINHIAGKKEADKISAMDSDFARWNRQVLGVGTQAGLNQFVTGLRQAFSDDYIEPNKTSYKAQYTREDLKRYGDENFINGSNVSQILFDTTQTTANMLPMIAASYLMTKAGLAPVAGELVGAGLMGLSSGGNTYQQALAEGWDKQDAKAYATILGAAEGTMQYLIGGIGALGGVGEEGLLKAATGINNAAVRFATETGIHILSETTEELAQNRLQRYLDYKLGATDDADWYSWTDDDWYTVVVTALSTGALEAPGVARSTFGAQRLGEQLSGQRIIPSKQEQGGNAVISEIGKAMQSDSALSYTLIAMATDTEMQGTDAYELAERMESGKAPKNAMNLGNLYRDVVNEYVARNGKGGYEDATAAIIGGATKYNALQSAKTELEAADQRAAEVRKENPGSEVLNANATELQGYGVNNTKQATEYGAILNKVMSGTDISDAEMDKLLGDSTAAKASRLILEKQNNDPAAVQQLRLSLTRENTEGARDVIKAQIQQFREEKAARKEAEKVSVVQAAMNAANKSEVSRAAANADLQEQVPAATVEAVQKADADVEAAQSRVKQIERMSFKELAAAKDLGLTEEAIDAGVVQDLQKQMAALNERAGKLAAVKFPSQQQRTQLADIREQQAAIKEQLVAAKMSSQSRVEQRAAAVQQAAAAPVQAEAAQNSSDSVPDIITIPGMGERSRAQFVQDYMAKNPGATAEQANARFDQFAEQTGAVKKGNAEKAKPERAKLTGKVEYWNGGALEGTNYDQVSEAEARELLGEANMAFLEKVLTKVANVTLIKSRLENGKYVGANGVFYRDGRIYLDVNAEMDFGERGIVLAAAHELTHFIAEYNNPAFLKLKDFVLNELKNKGMPLDERIKDQQARYKATTGKELSREKAEEEVVADACEMMLTDADAIKRFAAENPTEAKTILDWLTDFFNQIADAFKDLVAVHPEAKALQERTNQIREMWLNALVEADANAAKSSIDKLSDGGQKIVESLGQNATIQVDADGDIALAQSEDGKTIAFSMKTYEDSGKRKLIQALKENGHTQEEIDAVVENIEATGEFLVKVAQQFSDSHGYNNLMNNLWAGITTNIKTGKQAISTLVNNGDYPVNMDLQLICKKRVAYMRMLTRLIDDGVFEKVDFKGSAIADLNAVLRDGGFETACLGCFVESRRLQLQAWAETIVEEWNSAVDKRNPQAGDFNFAKGGNALSNMEIAGLITELENAGKKNDKGNLNLGKGAVEEKMGRLLDKVPSLVQHLTVADLLTPQGMSTLRSYDQNLFSLVKQRYGAASPKIVQDFNAYNSEIADLSFKFIKDLIGESVKGSGQYINQAKKTLKQRIGESKAAYNRRVETEAMRQYLYDIGGARIQSFSDFMIENVFDYLQIVADLSAREFPLHGYSKEAVFLRLFGMTGGKFNGSLIAHVEETMGKEYAGLLPAEEAENGRGILVDVDGKKYAICFDDYARHVATGSFIQSIGMKDIVALQLDPRYSKNVGSITIGVSDKQILAMLDSPYFRMVIPYHASGMIPEYAKLVGVSSYNDYTDYQTTKVNKCFDMDGNPVEGFWKADGKKIEIDTHYNFNEAVQRLGDAKAAANEYLEWCKQRHPVYDGNKIVGYATFTAKFSDSPYGTDFTKHENYYKLLEDFNSYDSIGEASALQGAVTMTLPSEATRLTAEQMAEYKQALRDTGLFTEKDIEKYAEKADMTFQELIAEEVGNRAEYESRQAKVWDETVDKAEKMLLEKYRREPAAKTEMRDNSIPSVEDVPTEAVVEESDGENAPSLSTRETDPATLKWLNEQVERGDYVAAYKTFLEVQNEDGTVSLYPPMASKQTDETGKRKMANSMAVGEWEKSVGNPNSKNIIEKNGKWYYRLIKDNGKTVDAAYDPYQHSSNVVLNDQFEEAYQRPGLVTYEVIIPKSELTEGYRYSAARDDGRVVEAALPVGEHPWKKGTVAGKLKNTDRTVYMTRWLMPSRRLDNSEVAQMYKDILAKEDSSVPVPFNVVPPGLLTELEKIGVPIDYEGSPMYKAHQQRKAEKAVIPAKGSSDASFSSRDTNAPENTNPYPENTLQHDMLEAARNGTLSEWVTEQMNAHEDALENAKIRPPVIPSKGFVPKVTAQEKAALENRRKGLIQAKGAMKPSEKSNGFAMPRADETGNRFRRFLQNAGSAEELKVAQDQVEKFAFTDVAGTYVPDSNKADLNWAKSVISEDGLDSAVKQFNREAMKMEMPSNVTKSLALGQQLLIETSRQGDMQKFLDVLSSLTLLSSQAGKSLQAFRMLKQSGPIGELYYVQKAVGQLNDRHAEKITAGRMAEITVPEDLANDVLMASTQEAQDKAMDALIAGIAAQVPVTLMDKWNAWRYLAMLGNARTHVRNVFGNAIFLPLRFAKDLMAAGGELLATKVGLMEEQDRRKAISVSRELRDFAKQDALAMKKELQGSGKYNPAREILDARKVLPGFLETLSRKNGELLELEDWWFLSPAYQSALSQALAHTGYSLSEMLDGSNKDAVLALNNARRIAIEEAQKATYRDFNAAASMLNRIKRMESGKASDKVIGVLLEGVLPFTKTPINILRRGVEYSPIGIASSIFEAAAGVKNGNLDVAQFIDHLSAGLSGTAVAVLGYLLASLGYIRNKKDDKEEEFDKLQGYQDYSVQIGKFSATIDWAAPTALPLFTGAAAYDMIRGGDDLEWRDAWDAMMMIAEPMMSLSMLDGLNSTLSAASYADDSQKLATVASSAFTSYLGQAFPTLFGQVARSLDGTRRSTYIDKNSPVPTAIQRFVQSSVQNKIPVWEEQKTPYIDQWGREDTVNSKALGALENFFSPSYINLVHTTDVDATLRELYDATKDSGVLPSTAAKYFSVAGERKDLTADEYVSYAKDVGSTKYQLLTSLFSDPRYMSLTDTQKAEAVSVIYKYATAAGKYHVDQNYDLHAQGKWIEEAEAAATDVQRFNRIWEYLEEHFKK